VLQVTYIVGAKSVLLGTTGFLLEVIVGAKAKILMVRLKPVTSQ
jgi:hypothetical protein